MAPTAGGGATHWRSLALGELEPHGVALGDDHGHTVGGGPALGQEEVLTARPQHEPQTVVAEAIAGLRLFTDVLLDVGTVQDERLLAVQRRPGRLSSSRSNWRARLALPRRRSWSWPRTGSTAPAGTPRSPPAGPPYAGHRTPVPGLHPKAWRGSSLSGAGYFVQ